jgi:hypothetical protein
VVRFLLDQGNPIPSPALLGRIGRGYVKAIERFAAEHEIPVVRFRKRESKEETARSYFERADAEGRTGVVLIGVAQEKASAWRGWRDGGPDSHPHFCFGRQTVFVNHYYFYILDRDFGPAFVKACSYASPPRPPRFPVAPPSEHVFGKRPTAAITPTTTVGASDK